MNAVRGSIREVLAGSAAAQAALLLALCLCLYWIGLGGAGLSMTEGHRAIPGWEMLERGDASVTRLFEQVYLRKPPGMPWAVAAASWVLGETEFAARSVSALSATLSVLAAWWFARRWFRAVWWCGLAAGLAQALSPAFVEPARTAEIEPLFMLGTQVASFALLDVLRGRASRWWWGMLVLGAVGACVSLLAKGPAGLPVIGAAVVVGLAMSDRRGRAAGRIGLFIAGIGLLIAPIAWWLVSRLPDEPAVVQSPSEFLWELSRLPGIALLPLAAIGAAAPASVGLLALFRPLSPADPEVARFARVLGFSVLVALGVFVVAGVSNPRYAMPALMLAAPLVGPMLSAWLAGDQASGSRAGAVRIGTIAAVVSCVVSVVWSESLRRGAGQRGSGREAGYMLAQSLVDAGIRGPVTLYADGLVEARPEVLWYAKLRAKELGLELRPVWRSSAVRAFEVPAGSYAVLRTDPAADEVRHLGIRGTQVAEGTRGQYTFVVLRIEDR